MNMPADMPAETAARVEQCGRAFTHLTRAYRELAEALVATTEAITGWNAQWSWLDEHEDPR